MDILVKTYVKIKDQEFYMYSTKTETYIPVKPLCLALGLNYKYRASQIRKEKRAIPVRIENKMCIPLYHAHAIARDIPYEIHALLKEPEFKIDFRTTDYSRLAQCFEFAQKCVRGEPLNMGAYNV